MRLKHKKALHNSSYSKLVDEMQNYGITRKVPVSVGQEEGLKVTSDLHSNRAALGSVSAGVDTFKILIGGPRDFPVLREKSIKVEPGKKTLCGAGRPGKAGHPQPPPHPDQVLSSSGILDLAPQDSKCYFPHLRLCAKYSLVNCRWESLRTSLCQLLQV